MPRHNGRMQAESIEWEIATTAARLIVEEGLDHGSAKRRALHQLALPARTRLPGNELIDEAVREHLALFCGETQPAELLALRELALEWMLRLTEFRPHLTGAVWNGTATRLSDVWLQLFCDDPKSAELALINRRQPYDVGSTKGFLGREVDVLSLSVDCQALGEPIGIHLVLYDADDVRGALRPGADGRKARGSVQDVQTVLRAVKEELFENGNRP